MRGATAPAPAQQPPPPPAAVPAPPVSVAGGLTNDQINQLKELGALKEQGILTEEEFAAQKAKLLG
jgi:hypothetical protein